MRVGYRVLLLVALVALASATAANATLHQMVADLDGAQEAPPCGPVATSHTGHGDFVYNDVTNLIDFDISYTGVTGTETAAHFHGPAAPGVAAPVTFGLPATNPKQGTVGPLSAAQETDLLNELWYVNIHSTFSPCGEIRGQVLFAPVPVESSTWGKIKSLYR